MASQLHIEVSGHGPALVLIHGLALHGGVFAPLVERLAPHFQLHVVDLPGHGRSRDSGVPLRLPFVVQAIARATPPAVWLGWSLGGLFALHAAATLPQVRGVAMIASTPRFIRTDDWPHAADAALFAQLERDLLADHDGTIARFLALDLHGSADDPAARRRLRSALDAGGAPTAPALHAGRQLLETTDLRRALAVLDTPSLWLAGQRDRLVPARMIQAAAALTPGASVQVLAGAGHAPFLGQPAQVAEALQRFIPHPD